MPDRQALLAVQKSQRELRIQSINNGHKPLEGIAYAKQSDLEAVKESLANTEAYLRSIIERSESKKGVLDVRFPVQRRLSIPVAIDEGGTGATTLAQAQTNLGITASGGTTVPIGSPTVDGSWQIIVVGNDLSVQRRESGAWVEKGSFLAT